MRATAFGACAMAPVMSANWFVMSANGFVMCAIGFVMPQPPVLRYPPVAVHPGGKHMTTRWTAAEAVRAAEALITLAAQFRAKLEARMGAGFIDGLAADTASLRDLLGGTSAQRATKRASTVSQNDAVAEGAALVANLRALVRTGAAGQKAVWRAWGVGQQVNHTVSSVEKGLASILAAASADPAQARAIGVLQEDLDRAGKLLAAVSAADSTQERKKISSKQATAAANATQARLEANLVHLTSLAAVALDRETAAQFAAALPASRGGKKKKKPEAA